MLFVLNSYYLHKNIIRVNLNYSHFNRHVYIQTFQFWFSSLLVCENSQCWLSLIRQEKQWRCISTRINY